MSSTHYNPEKRVWKGKSYRRGGVTGNGRGTTIREERENDLERTERNTHFAAEMRGLGEVLLSMFPDQCGSMTSFKAPMAAFCCVCGQDIARGSDVLHHGARGLRHFSCS